MPIPKGRRKRLRVRRKKLPGDKYLECDIMEKAGPKGGKTVCHVKKKKQPRKKG